MKKISLIYSGLKNRKNSLNIYTFNMKTSSYIVFYSNKLEFVHITLVAFRNKNKISLVECFRLKIQNE